MGKQWYNKKSKYGNKPVTIDGTKYDSTGEGTRMGYLKLLERAGEIKDLQYHKKFELIPELTEDVVVHLKTKNKIVKKVVQRARYYEADYTYTKVSTGEEVVEDFKGMVTPLFEFKAALFRYKYGKEIKIVKHINEPI